jgi:hypothetical protein
MYFFWKISGGDVTILRKCNPATRRMFTMLGLFVFVFHVLVFLGFLCTFLYVTSVIQPSDGESNTVISYSIASESETSVKNVFVSLLSAAFLTFVFGNIYLLTIATFSRNVLPIRTSVSSTTFSIALRISFLVFLAIVISKPIEVMLVQGTSVLNNDIRSYKDELHKQLDAGPLNDSQSDEIRNKVHYTIDHGNFFLHKVGVISLTGKYAWTWIITVLVVVLFVYPVIVKHQLKADSPYYLKLKEIQVDIIKRSYEGFKQNFSAITAEQTGTPMEFYEPYEDAPFNTIRKCDNRKSAFRKQEEFLNLFTSHESG